MPLNQIFSETEKLMKKSIDRLVGDFATVRTGRASPAILDAVRVNYYGSAIPIQQVGNVVVSEGRTLEIRPWDMSVIPELEKAILQANLGVTPNSDGKVVRLSFPPLSEDRRKELVKVVKKIAEDFRVSLRNERRLAMEKVRSAEKSNGLSQDDRKLAENKIQALTDSYIKRIDALLSSKEREILEV